MKRITLKKPGELIVEEAVEPEPGPGEALVRVSQCGICGSDVHSYLGKHPFVRYPVTPGHEFSGEIIRVGKGVARGFVGSVACVEPSITCGQCAPCLSGHYNICENLRVLGFQAPGAMCEAVVVPADKIHLLPLGVDLAGGALVEPTAVGVRAVRRSGVESGAWVVVIGSGVIGLMVLKAARSLGCHIVAVEADSKRARRALDLGADFALVSTDDIAPIIRDTTGGINPGAVFECAGKPETAELAVRLAPRGSTVVMVGVFSGEIPIPLSLVQDGEIDVRGTMMYMAEDFEKALEMIATGQVDTDDFVTHRVGLDEVERGYKLLADPEIDTLKVMVDIQGGP